MEMLHFDAPTLTPADVLRIASDVFGVGGATQRVRGERSHNTIITTDDGRQLVLKVAGAAEPDSTVDLEVAAMVHVAHAAPGLPIPRVLPALDGQRVPVVEHDGQLHRVRLVTFLPGIPFEDDQAVSDRGLRAIGELLGAIASALTDFEHPAADDFMAWDIANGLVLDADLRGGAGPDALPLIERALPRLEAGAEAMKSLPRQVIHNDGHAGNLLRTDESSDLATGVIDFGDVMRTVTAADIGVSGANLVPHQAEPVAALAALTAGYHARQPLSAAEVAAIPDLVLTRIVLSTLLVDHQIATAPHIAGEVAAERPQLLANLDRWLSVVPADAASRIADVLN